MEKFSFNQTPEDENDDQKAVDELREIAEVIAPPDTEIIINTNNIDAGITSTSW